MKPGIAIFPASSITRVAGPVSGCICGAVPHRHDAITDDGDCLGDWLPVVERDNDAAAKDKVGVGSAGRGSRSDRGQRGSRKKQ